MATAEFLAHDTPVSMVIGQTLSVNLRVKNTGTVAWQATGAHAMHIGYKWLNARDEPQLDVEDRRTALPRALAPDQSATFGAILVAPQTPGSYFLLWDVIGTANAWFGAGLRVPISVTATPRDTTGWRAESNVNPAQVARALDGDSQSCWDSGAPQSPGQWFRLNLSAPRMLDGIQILSPGKGFPAGYVLRVSADGNSWIEIARVVADHAHDVFAVFAPQLVQYVQIDLLTASPNAWMIAAILVHAATAWKATASHNPSRAACALDNRADTAWSSDASQTSGMWFQLDLGRVETISGLQLDAQSDAHPANFRVTTWNARASRWQIAYERAHNHDAVDADFAATQTQFINIQITARANRPWSITRARVLREMESWLGATIS
ncbi:MAG: discoidin domain-containing protein [Chloroflexi bacterium]|nr:discoidin domain-containing protein [Chloroflexota bacterium]